MMELHYPDGRKFNQSKIPSNKIKKDISYGKRGMNLEEDINETNQYYLTHNIAVIHKKPTPIQIVNVDYKSRSTAVIREAYFRQASTTDYNGVFKGMYIDFEAKETTSTTSFPLKNFHTHQIDHMKAVIDHGGISFVILRFVKSDEIFLLDAKYLFEYWKRMNQGGRKSITKDEIVDNGHQINYGYHPRLDYLPIIERIYNINGRGSFESEG